MFLGHGLVLDCPQTATSRTRTTTSTSTILLNGERRTVNGEFKACPCLLCALRWTETHNRRHRRSTHPKNFRVRIFDFDSDWESLSNPHPVKVSFHKRQALDLDIIFLRLYRRRNPLDDSVKTPIWIRQQINLGSHAGTYVL